MAVDGTNRNPCPRLAAPPLDQHDRRTAELEAEYLRHFPEREIGARRLRP